MEQAGVAPDPIRRAVSAPKRVWQFIRRWPIVPGFVLGSLVILAVFGPWIAPHTETEIVGARHTPPVWQGGTWEAPLGTDHIGRDLMSRIIIGARLSLLVSATAVTVGFIVGTGVGLLAGYVSGLVDEVITRAVDIWLALPFLMVALVAVIAFGQSLIVVLALLATTAWVGFVRIIRAQTYQLKEMDYIAYAKVAGSGSLRIMWRHLLPGVINSALVIATLSAGGLILAEATLSFLGAGIPAPTPAWGVLVSEGRQYLVGGAWWQPIMPGVAIFLVVMSLNFLGDWTRDRLDPRLRQLNE